MKLMFTHRSTENTSYVYYANIIRDEDRMLNGKPSYFWFGDADEDKDGSPDWENDGAGQAETSLRLNGKSINGNEIEFLVVPPQLINMTSEIVLGCVGTMMYEDKVVACVVADSGPSRKIGEASSAALKALGLPITRNGNGGLDSQEVLYRIWPGVPANINGIQFQLQKS